MNIRPTIRAATGSDRPLLRRFQQATVAAEWPFDPTLKSGELHYYDGPPATAYTLNITARGKRAGVAFRLPLTSPLDSFSPTVTTPKQLVKLWP